jgi:hypothetical protein
VLSDRRTLVAILVHLFMVSDVVADGCRRLVIILFGELLS